jgi:hypothetical protein
MPVYAILVFYKIVFVLFVKTNSLFLIADTGRYWKILLIPVLQILED